MAGILTVNLDAPAGATLGMISSLEDELAAVPGIVDVWRIDPGLITRGGDNRVSAWTGMVNGRQFIQANAARRPLYVPGSRLDMGNGAAARASMLLSGAQLGQMATGSIGMRITLDAGDETVDAQNIAGQDLDSSGTGIARLAYRYIPATLGNYIRLQIAAANLDVDLDPAATTALIWLTISAGEARIRVNGVEGAAALAVANLNLPTFAIGGSREPSPSFAGGITGLCIAGSVLDADQRAAAEWAMINPVSG